MAKIQEVLPAESGSNAEPLEKVQYDAEYNMFANERQHFEQPKSINDTHLVEKDDSNVIPDSLNMCDNDNQADKNAKECDDERSTLEECKSSLEKSNRTRGRYLGALHDKEVELENYKLFKDRTIEKTHLNLQNNNIAIRELKKLIEKCKGKSVETKFDKPSIVRQPNALRIQKPSFLGKPTPFLDSLERKSFSKTNSVTKTNVFEGLSKPVTTQILPQTARQAIRNTNVIKPGMYQIDTMTTQTRASQSPQTSINTNPRVSTSTGVIHNTSASRPQLRSTQMKEKVHARL
ncbi:hypothetical protein Tco_0065253 [Tanacetum coccineum]